MKMIYKELVHVAKIKRVTKYKLDVLHLQKGGRRDFCSVGGCFLGITLGSRLILASLSLLVRDDVHGYEHAEYL